MSLDPHVHCAECFAAIETKLKIAGGKTKNVEVHMGQQLVSIMGPQGPVFMPRPVPLCPACLERIKAEEKCAAAASKLIVPQVHPVARQ